MGDVAADARVVDVAVDEAVREDEFGSAPGLEVELGFDAGQLHAVRVVLPARAAKPARDRRGELALDRPVGGNGVAHDQVLDALAEQADVQRAAAVAENAQKADLAGVDALGAQVRIGVLPALDQLTLVVDDPDVDVAFEKIRLSPCARVADAPGETRCGLPVQEHAWCEARLVTLQLLHHATRVPQ